MPAKKQYRKKRAAPKRRQAPRRRMARRSGNVAEYASLSCTSTYTSGQCNTMYSLMNTQLSTFDRAVAVSRAYQFYRIKNIKMRFKPQWDTFANTGNAYTKPYLYYMIDKSGSIPSTVNLEGLKQMGAKPRVLDEKSVVVSWAPSVLEFSATNVTSGVGLPNKYKIGPWLNTNEGSATTIWNPSTVDHLGIYYIGVSSLTGTANPIVYDIEVEVQFEFKKPLVDRAVTTVAATPAVPALKNDSVDGIVGGPDGI